MVISTYRDELHQAFIQSIGDSDIPRGSDFPIVGGAAASKEFCLCSQTASVLLARFLPPLSLSLCLLNSPSTEWVGECDKASRRPAISPQSQSLTLYRGANKGLYVLLSRTQAGPGRTVKQEQEEISRNHAHTFISPSVKPPMTLKIGAVLQRFAYNIAPINLRRVPYY